MRDESLFSICTIGLVLVAAAGPREMPEVFREAAKSPGGVMSYVTALEDEAFAEALTKGELAVMLLLVPVGAAMLWENPKFFPDSIWDRGLAWYPMLLTTPGICIAIAAVSDRLSRVSTGRAFNRAMEALGGLTFEIYLVHFWALEKPWPVFLLMTAGLTAVLHGVSVLIRREMKKRAA